MQQPARTPSLSPSPPPSLSLTLAPDLREALDDLADATGRQPEDLALDAVRARLREEEARVRGTAERLAGAHAELLRRLGE